MFLQLISTVLALSCLVSSDRVKRADDTDPLQLTVDHLVQEVNVLKADLQAAKTEILQVKCKSFSFCSCSSCSCSYSCSPYAFLHFYEIVEGLYFHSSLSLCVCVCVCVRLSVCVSNFLVNKIPAERIHRFGRGFH